MEMFLSNNCHQEFASAVKEVYVLYEEISKEKRVGSYREGLLAHVDTLKPELDYLSNNVKVQDKFKVYGNTNVSQRKGKSVWSDREKVHMDAKLFHVSSAYHAHKLRIAQAHSAHRT